MSGFGEYLVTGRREYRGHKPGSTFEATLDRNAEARAIRRGDIRLLRIVKPELQPDSYTLPPGWAKQSSTPAVTTAPEGAFSMPEGG